MPTLVGLEANFDPTAVTDSQNNKTLGALQDPR